MIFTEMARQCELDLHTRKDFITSKTMGGINPKVKKYRGKSSAVESVLCLQKS
jgi:hypothetical protein